MAGRPERRYKEMREYRKKLILTSIITLLPMVIGLLMWDKLPDKMATHFGSDNVANGWSSKTFAVIGLPVIMTVLHIIAMTVTLNDPKKKNISRKMLSVIFWLIPVLSWIGNLMTYSYALNMQLNIGMTMNIFMGILFILIGNYMSKNRQNYTVGIRVPWTLNSRENWNRTHRLAAVLWILGGAVFLINSFIQTSIVIYLILLIALVPVVYSFILYKKGI